MNYHIRLVIAFLFILAGINIAPAQLRVENTIWKNEDFNSIPAFRISDEDSIQSIIFESVPYKGKKKSVFAFYATPGMLDKNKGQDKKLPGIILVHGGGGTAFREWAIMWAKRGYAALALDTRGNGPDKKHIDGGFEENGLETPYFDVTLPLNEQWLYQAVSDVINAHTLLMSFPEVDKDRTAITGISWGGVLTCISSSLDGRFKAAVPVYGCGFLSESGRMKKQLDMLSRDQRSIWMKQYDPSNYLSLMNRPILFINGTNDVHFYLPSMSKSAALPPCSKTLIKQGLRHGHKHGWTNDEIEAFINQHLRHAAPLPEIINEQIKKDTVYGEIVSVTPIKNMTLHYTTSSGQEQEKYDWLTADVTLKGNKWTAVIPQKASRWYVNATDSNGIQISGQLHFTE